MYKFLVTNDDGIDSAGIKALVKALSRLGAVYVVAPSEEQSAKSMSVTFLRTVHAEEVELENAEVAYRLNGTPADCIKWGLDIFSGFTDFDFVVSGINTGYNLGATVYYSGTVAAAREGSLNGMRSIALSVGSLHADQFSYICGMLPELLEMSLQLDSETLLNVNVPNLPSWKIKGVRIAEGAKPGYGHSFHFTDAGNGEYQMGVVETELDENLENDFNLTDAGYAVITPITLCVSDRHAVKRLKGFFVADPIFVFIDIQDKMLEGIRKRRKLIKNLRKWARCVDRLDMPVLFTRMYGMGKTLKEITECIERSETVERMEFNACESPGFGRLLNAGVNKKVYITGLETHVGVEQTALSLLDEGYEVVVIEDCCISTSANDHRNAINNMRNAGCRIETCESAVMDIVESSNHPAYKKIREILSD